MPTTVAVDTAQQVLDKYRPVMTNLSENYPKAKSFGTLSIFIIAPKMAFGMLEIVLHPHFSLSLSSSSSSSYLLLTVIYTCTCSSTCDNHCQLSCFSGEKFLQESTEQKAGPKLAVGDACTCVAVNLGGLEGEYPDITERWMAREKELAQNIDWQSFKVTSDHVSAPTPSSSSLSPSLPPPISVPLSPFSLFPYPHLLFSSFFPLLLPPL